MSEQQSQMLGLIGFVLAGLVFIAAGVKSGDPLTVIGRGRAATAILVARPILGVHWPGVQRRRIDPLKRDAIGQF